MNELRSSGCSRGLQDFPNVENHWAGAAQFAGGPVDCDVSHAFLPVCDERLREVPKAKMPE